MEKQSKEDFNGSSDELEEIKKELKDHKNLEESKLSYSKDKKGWVTFKNGKKKIKLRKHIANSANLMCKYNNFSFTHNRSYLVKVYNNYGLKGIYDAILDTLQIAREKAQKEALEHVEILKNGTEEEKEKIIKNI